MVRPSGIPWAPVWAPIEKHKEVDFGRYSRGPPLWAPIGKHNESKSGGIPMGLHCGPPQWAPIEKHSESKSSGIPVGPHCGPPQWAPIEKYSESKSSGIPVGPHCRFFFLVSDSENQELRIKSQRVKEYKRVKEPQS